MRRSKPGERRGGRQKGTPNKKTAAMRAVMAVHANDPNAGPLDVMLGVMRDPHVALDGRVKMALMVLPHLHRKLRAGEGAPSANQFERAQRTASARSTRPPPAEAVRDRDDEKPRPASEAATLARRANPTSDCTPAASGNGRAADGDRANGTGVMPLPFLLDVLSDPKAPAALKLKIASVTLPYVHARPSKRCLAPRLVPDQYGFTVDPALAAKLRNAIARLGVLKKRQNPSARELKSMQRISAEIDAQLEALACPSPEQYSVLHAARDHERVQYLWQKRRTRQKLVPTEDAELAHINARYSGYRFGPESAARQRLRRLQEKARILRGTNGRLTGKEGAELAAFSLLYPRELPQPDANREALHESNSIFSLCQFDADGFPMRFATGDW